ncbi:TetR/AcrR family transcriptional regulator [Pyxidicoccus trucidator]|uniref:TetR/AcrR family transcriptional regulator n=1 Tax=Pyxidicoccus trucidator TaxID=2709662 RepID=UPI0019685EE6|nr:TetR/AcrR family transcriptional regulator C-terminal domain-containing protein [Pyxidicoccus trucidator]
MVATAVAVVREQGLRQLSMRTLAERLGATPMAVYKHVESRDALALLTVEAIFQPLTLPDERLEPVPWLRELAARVRALGLAHRGVMEFLLDEGPVAHTTLVILDRTVRKLHDAGLPWDEAGALHNTFFSWLAGAVRRQEPSPSFQRFFDAAAALPASDYPGLAHSLPHMRATEVEREFEASLGFMLEGIQRRIDARTAPAPKPPRPGQD